ncbi:hypothetical protein [Vreelandella venusta]|uniref:hypothetical protein n=1 Tax=Vreelandella venusta TaxID=44935 RepID=UPI003F674B55
MNYPNMRMIIDNLHDSATLTATSAALPIAYTQRSGRSYVWRSTSTATQVITGTLSSVQPLDGGVVYSHNLSPTAMIRWEFLANGSVVYDSGTVSTAYLVTPPNLRVGIDPWGLTYADALPADQTVRWPGLQFADQYRITISDPANPDGYIEIGRIVIGFAFSPVYNPAYGLSLTWQENAEQVRTEGGSLRTITSNGQSRLLNIDLNFLESGDRTRLTTDLVKVGKQGDIFVSVYPEQGGIKELEHSFIARRENDYGHSARFYNIWQSQLSLAEV